jgi:hypothetical protein
MAVTTMDTHEVVKELLAAGFSGDQAEAVTRVVRRSQDIDLSNFVTKADLAATKAELLAGLASTRTQLQTDLVSTRTELQADLASTKADLQAGLAATRAELQIGLAETKAEILKWMVGSMGVQTVVLLGAVVTIVKMMVH